MKNNKYMYTFAVSVGFLVITGCYCNKSNSQVISNHAEGIVISVGAYDITRNDRPYITTYYQIDKKDFEDFFNVLEQATQPPDKVLGSAQLHGYEVTVYIANHNKEVFRRVTIVPQWVEGMGGKNDFDGSGLNDRKSIELFEHFYLDKGNVISIDIMPELLNKMESQKEIKDDHRYWRHEGN